MSRRRKDDGFFARATRRIDAVAALEKAAGGDDEATWAIQAVTAYYQQGGTLERLQATMVGDVEAAAMDAVPDPDLTGRCEGCGQPGCTGWTPVPLRQSFLNLGVPLDPAEVQWVSYPLVESMPDDVELAADDFDKQLPSRFIRISDVHVSQHHDNGRPTGRWFGAAAVTQAANLLG